jgi:leader peptidase (prepilin peptidase)/N-methyltransferase
MSWTDLQIIMPPDHITAGIVFLMGLCIGSFLNVCIFRLPENRSVISPPSACPKCGHRLRWYENLPLVSYLVLRGRCSGCGTKISIQYPLVELLTAAIAVLLFFKFHLSVQFAIMFGLSCCLIVVSFIDLAHRIIPDIISLPGILAGIIASFFLPGIDWIDSLLGILAGGGILYLVTWGYYLVTKKVGMGGGDIKLLAMIGAFLGWQAIPFIIFMSSAVGAVVGIIFIIFSGKGRHYQIPFGPFLALAAQVQILFGDRILALYLGGFSSGA